MGLLTPENTFFLFFFNDCAVEPVSSVSGILRSLALQWMLLRGWVEMDALDGRIY